jgi:hypothetical protein
VDRAAYLARTGHPARPGDAVDREIHAWATLGYLGAGPPTWCDHSGTATDPLGRPLFIAEPYHFGREKMAALLAFVDRYGLIVMVAPLTYHNTGACVRIELRLPDTWPYPDGPGERDPLAPIAGKPSACRP